METLGGREMRVDAGERGGKGAADVHALLLVVEILRYISEMKCSLLR